MPAAEQADVAAGVRELTARLAAATRDRHTLSALDDLPTFRRRFSPVTGVGNGFAPPVLFRREGDTVVGEATLGCGTRARRRTATAGSAPCSWTSCWAAPPTWPGGGA